MDSHYIWTGLWCHINLHSLPLSFLHICYNITYLFLSLNLVHLELEEEKLHISRMKCNNEADKMDIFCSTLLRFRQNCGSGRISTKEMSNSRGWWNAAATLLLFGVACKWLWHRPLMDPKIRSQWNLSLWNVYACGMWQEILSSPSVGNAERVVCNGWSAAWMCCFSLGGVCRERMRLLFRVFIFGGC